MGEIEKAEASVDAVVTPLSAVSPRIAKIILASNPPSLIGASM
jgi:hypothetical protein